MNENELSAAPKTENVTATPKTVETESAKDTALASETSARTYSEQPNPVSVNQTAAQVHSEQPNPVSVDQTAAQVHNEQPNPVSVNQTAAQVHSEQPNPVSVNQTAAQVHNEQPNPVSVDQTAAQVHSEQPNPVSVDQTAAPHGEPPSKKINSKKTKKYGKFASAMAAVLAVVLLGTGSGFCGAYVAGKILNGDSYPNYPVSKSKLYVNQNTPVDTQTSLLSIATLGKNTNTAVLRAEDLFEKVSPSVVGIKIYYNTKNQTPQIVQDPFGFGGGFGGQFAPQPARPQNGIVGTGVVFTTDGYILTNHHVISDAADKITVVVDDYDKPGNMDATKEYEAKIVGSDEASDLAVLKITRKDAFKAAALGNSAGLKVGQTVCAIGFPMGVGKSMTQGIVSGLNRVSGEGGYELHSIQTDAAVNMGNSGGPLFDMYGNVVGIVNKKIVYENLVENIGYAITIDEAKPIINDLLKDGVVTSRPILGITTLQLNEYSASAMGYDVKSGLLVTAINPKSPAKKDGLAVGDIITKIENKDVTSVASVQDITKSLKPNDKISVTVVRFDQNGKKTNTELKITLTTQKALE